MSRQQYEDEWTLAAERTQATDVADAIGDHVRLHKLPVSYRVDYAICSAADGCVWGVLELKRREHELDRYPTLILAAGKYMEARRWSMLGIPAFLAVRCRDGDYIHRLRRDPYHVAIGGRKDRNDPADIEPVVHIPIEDFEPLDSFKWWPDA